MPPMGDAPMPPRAAARRRHCRRRPPQPRLRASSRAIFTAPSRRARGGSSESRHGAHCQSTERRRARTPRKRAEESPIHGSPRLEEIRLTIVNQIIANIFVSHRGVVCDASFRTVAPPPLTKLAGESWLCFRRLGLS